MGNTPKTPEKVVVEDALTSDRRHPEDPIDPLAKEGEIGALKCALGYKAITITTEPNPKALKDQIID